ncbi:MAG TPA: N-acetylmuramoyl-L-alanine amidase CwlD, partial [Bacilli bacterium]
FFMKKRRRRRIRILIWLSRRGAARLALLAFALAFLLLYFTSDLKSGFVWEQWSLPLSGKVIAIDAGHGGPDGGAESSEGIAEKNINLAIAKMLRDYLQQTGAVVVMTREEDKDLADKNTAGLSKRKTEDLVNRARLIKSRKAELLVSIHLNSIPSARWHGAQTFYDPKNEMNKLLAQSIQAEIKAALQNTDREANTVRTLFLLRTSDVPSALVEAGFLSNPEEAKLLAKPEYQKKMAAAIYRGILRFYSGVGLGS